MQLFLDGTAEKTDNDNAKEVDFFDQCHNDDNNKDAFFDNNNVQSNNEKVSITQITSQLFSTKQQVSCKLHAIVELFYVQLEVVVLITLLILCFLFFLFKFRLTFL